MIRLYDPMQGTTMFLSCFLATRASQPSISCSQCVGMVLLTRRSRIVRNEIRGISRTQSLPSVRRICQNTAHFAFLFASFLSFFPPFSNSRCPAFSAMSFSVCPIRPEELLCLILFCWMSEAFFGLTTRAPGLVCCFLLPLASPVPAERARKAPAQKSSRRKKAHFFCTTGLDFVLIAP